MINRGFGWAGRILRVNLSDMRINIQDLPEDLALQFIGCRGINIALLYNELHSGIDPFGSENKLIFGIGPLSGTPVGQGKVSVAAKSPRGCVAEGSFGGFWGPELRFAGYDHVIIEGKAEKPVYIWINGDQIQIRDATKLWGKTTWETDSLIKQELSDDNLQIAYVGPAAENGVSSCPVISNLNHSGGRNVGTIMGSKKLKAIAVRGYGGVKVAHAELFERTYKKILESIDVRTTCDPWVPLYALWGSVGDVKLYNFTGNIHSFNAQKLGFDDPKGKVSAERLLERYVVKGKASFGCPWPGCGKWYEIRTGEFAGTKGQNLWSGDLMIFSGLVGCKSVQTALKARSMCNQYGLDIYHVAYSIAWAMECHQRGILRKKDTDGIELKFGNYHALLQMINKIALREGFGDVLAQGVEKAAKIVGKGSERFGMTIKGTELESLTERNSYQVALGLATSASGPDHTKWLPPVPINPSIASPSILKDKFGIDIQELGISLDLAKASETTNPEGKGELMKWLEDTRAVIEALPACIFLVKGRLSLDFKIWNNILNATTGEDFGYDQMLQCGERIVNCERAFIAREGFSRKDDKIPRRMLEDAVPEFGYGPISNKDFEKMLDDYYQARGWNKETGIPTAKKLAELGLEKMSKNSNFM